LECQSLSVTANGLLLWLPRLSLVSRNNLALDYRDAGRLAEAVRLLARTLANYERPLGGEHPDTLRARNNLATGYWDAGRLAEAVPLLERTLADFERLLSAEHRTRKWSVAIWGS
jgi:tetratricopeptide (TPR) repeat protein